MHPGHRPLLSLRLFGILESPSHRGIVNCPAIPAHRRQFHTRVTPVDTAVAILNLGVDPYVLGRRFPPAGRRWAIAAKAALMESG